MFDNLKYSSYFILSSQQWFIIYIEEILFLRFFIFSQSAFFVVKKGRMGAVSREEEHLGLESRDLDLLPIRPQQVKLIVGNLSSQSLSLFTSMTG